MLKIFWTDYLRYRASLRGYDLEIIENIVRHSSERYFDSETNRMVAVGKHGSQTVVVPYEANDETVTPVTVHAVTKQQIKFRVTTGRFEPYE